MKTFRADLHIHSRFSRATSKRLCVPHLAAWGLVKGLKVLGTGDFTHPGWREELERDLVPDEESGLYRPRMPLTDESIESEIPGFGRPASRSGDGPAQDEPLFVLQAEISSIYKRDGATRKVHNLVFMPDFESVDILNRKLAAIGNLASDGRPILGLDSERLLELVLESSERGVLIPAHIWTPWFSLFGSKSGFDELEACFGALSEHIFALETGLSSDPDMNRLWSRLDGLTLISNSDAHSGENLGREANLFEGRPSYDGLFNALRNASSGIGKKGDCVYRGTLEFFPEEGKYHLDGHRACNVVLEPGESRRLGDICPVCGKPLTVGVLHRVLDLADREQPVHAADDPGFASLIPLPEILGELLRVGSGSRKVRTRQAELVALFGSELDILQSVPEAALRRHWDALGEAIARMRAGRVIRRGGYDGEYGVVRVFDDAELASPVTGQKRASLPGMTTAAPTDTTGTRRTRMQGKHADVSEVVRDTGKDKDMEAAGKAETGQGDFPFSADQRRAIAAGPHPVLVLAGPGAGKTRTLIGRIVRLLNAPPAERVPASRILAVTFTRRAAGELRERLRLALHDRSGELPRADTLHALALACRAEEGAVPVILSEKASRAVFGRANACAEDGAGRSRAELRRSWERLSLARERMEPAADAELADMAARYAVYKRERNLADYTDLLEDWLELLRTKRASGLPLPWTEILVDEVQDLSPLQVAVVRALLPDSGQGFFGIGDPDQSIYGFRGAHPDIGTALALWPDLEVVTLRESHRSTPAILDAAASVLGPASACGRLVSVRQERSVLHHFHAPDAAREAAWVAEQAARLVGATSHTLLDASRRNENAVDTLDSPCAPGDLAVLVRMKSLIPPLRTALEQRGVPCAVPESAPFWEDSRTALLLALAGQHLKQPFLMPSGIPEGRENISEAETRLSIPGVLWAKGPSALLSHLEGQDPFDPLFRESDAWAGLLQAYRREGSWEALLAWVMLRQEGDLVRAGAERVQIMTLHAAKGLEFRAVFLPALEEGILPLTGFGAPDSPSASRDPADPDEERRLFYVGLTRAAEAVFLSHADRRQIHGREVRLQPSRFLADTGSLFRHSRLVRHTRLAASQMSLI